MERSHPWTALNALKRSLLTLNGVVGVPSISTVEQALLKIIEVLELSSGSSKIRLLWDDLKAQLKILNAEAAVATFLAVVQSQILALSIPLITTSIHKATNALGFMGVLFDVIAAFFALLSSTVLQKALSDTERILDRIDALRAEEVGPLWTELTGMPLPPPPLSTIQRIFILGETSSGLWSAMRQSLIIHIEAKIPTSNERAQEGTTSATHGTSPPFLSTATSPAPDLRQLEHHCILIERGCRLGDAAGISILLGVCCFLGSVVCLAKSTQPMSVWIPTIISCSSIVFLPLVKLPRPYSDRTRTRSERSTGPSQMSVN